MGCEVVVFSGTNSKREESMKLGAKEFYAAKGVQELKITPIDHLLVTTSVRPDWSTYLPIMAPSGTIYPLSVSEGDLKMPYMPVIQSGLKIQGSLVAAREIHRKMLEFAAVHDIKAIIEKFPMNVEGVEKAFQSINSLQVSFYVHRSSVFHISAMFPASLAFLSLQLPRCSPMPEEGGVEPFSITAQLRPGASETPRRSKLIGYAELSSISAPSFLF